MLKDKHKMRFHTASNIEYIIRRGPALNWAVHNKKLYAYRHKIYKTEMNHQVLGLHLNYSILHAWTIWMNPLTINRINPVRKNETTSNIIRCDSKNCRPISCNHSNIGQEYFKTKGELAS